MARCSLVSALAELMGLADDDFYWIDLMGLADVSLGLGLMEQMELLEQNKWD